MGQCYTKIFKRKQHIECPICFGRVNDYNNFYRMGCCKNIFHLSCISAWRKINNTCPFCRKTFYIIEKVKVKKCRRKKKKRRNNTL